MFAGVKKSMISQCIDKVIHIDKLIGNIFLEF